MAEIADDAFAHQRRVSKSQPWEVWEGKQSKKRSCFCFSGYQFCDYHLGRHSASFLFGARDPKPTPYGKAGMLWRLWRQISRQRQHLLDHWI